MSRRDDWEQHWSAYADSSETNPAQAWRRSLVLDALALRAGDRLLDVGSGQGDLVVAALGRADGLQAVGLELAASGVARASAKAPMARFRQVDLLGAAPLVDAYRGWATKVCCSEVLEHLDDPVAFLRNALLHAAPGARVVVTVPAGPRTAFDRHIGHRRHYTRESLKRLLEDAGLKVRSTAAPGFPMFNLYRLVVWLRGRRLITDVDSDGDGPSRVATLAMRAFARVMRFSSRQWLGWQLVAEAEVVEVASRRHAVTG